MNLNGILTRSTRIQ